MLPLCEVMDEIFKHFSSLKQGKFSICQNNKSLILRSLWYLGLSKHFELMGQNQAKHLAVHHSLFMPTHCQGIFPTRCEVESPAHLFPCMCLLDT